MPRLRALGPQLSQSVADEMAALGVSGTKEELAKAHKTRVQKLVRGLCFIMNTAGLRSAMCPAQGETQPIV
jgi:hypothetical protein